MNARKSSMFLFLMSKLKPGALDAIIPHGPKVSGATREYLIAMAIKGFSAELNDREISGKLGRIQKMLVEVAGRRLVADYGDDDWCGTPWPKRFPPPEPDPFPWFPFTTVTLNPQPLPPRALQKEIGGYLLLLSEATSHKDASKALQTLGNRLMR